MSNGLLRTLIRENEDGSAIVGSNSVPVSELFGALEGGMTWEEAVSRFRSTPTEALSAVVFTSLGPSKEPRLPLSRSRPTFPKIRHRLRQEELNGLFPGLSAPSSLALSAGLLQIFDFWDESHEAAQNAEDQGETFTSAYWHGIAHRREPDAGNASYWFRRVGKHPVLDALASRVEPWIEGVAALKILTEGGKFQPFRFIESATRPTSEVEPLLRRIQREETALLIEASIAGRP